jgi:DNA mismatch repair ATPase MutS
LDEDFVALESFIKDTEDIIKTGLEYDLLRCESKLHSTFGALAELDFIKNNTMIDQKSHINIVIGSNFSGKSCYLNQVGVLIYLVHFFHTISYSYTFF